MTELHAPFPYFGGKSRIASVVWERLGRVEAYFEPFLGSAAVLLARPGGAYGAETVNDLDAHLCNFWRALQADPDGVARWADWPVSELDLHARHTWLLSGAGAERIERLRGDPEYYDVQAAGWWLWGICQWIGSGWCRELHRKLPAIGDNGRGYQAKGRQQIPAIGTSGRGYQAKGKQQRPLITTNGTGLHRSSGLASTFADLSSRLRRVRICCGDWPRILFPSLAEQWSPIGIFLDPPYGDTRAAALYAHDSLTVYRDVTEWCREHGTDHRLRIALCGYEGEHDDLEAAGWDVVAWKTQGGYSVHGSAGEQNSRRERIWFSPGCLPPAQSRLL